MNIDCNQINQTYKKHYQKAICVFVMEKNNSLKPQNSSSLQTGSLSMFIPMLGLTAVSLFRPYVTLVK